MEDPEAQLLEYKTAPLPDGNARVWSGGSIVLVFMALPWFFAVVVIALFLEPPWMYFVIYDHLIGRFCSFVVLALPAILSLICSIVVIFRRRRNLADRHDLGLTRISIIVSILFMTWVFWTTIISPGDPHKLGNWP